MKKVAPIAFAAMLLVLGGNALAAGGPTVTRMGKAGESGVSVSNEKGVRIYRGPAIEREARAGGGEAPSPADKTIIIKKKVIVEHHYHAKIRHLRTQGFYSGHPGESRRFTQGFYSGPVDKGGN